MSNKLEEYLDKRAKEIDGDYGSESSWFRNGFNEAINLNLPVLFAEWMYGNTKEYFRGGTYSVIEVSGLDYNLTYTAKELYDYWISNVFKTNEL